MAGRLRSRAAGQDGFAMITAMGVLMIVLLVTAGIATGAISSRGQATRSTLSGKALAAAEAAANLGWERANVIGFDTKSAGSECASGNATTGVLSASTYNLTTTTPDWCPSVPVFLPGATAAAYRMSAATVSGTTNVRYVVGTATVGSVTRRVRITVGGTATTTTTPYLQGFGLISVSDLFLGNQTLVSGGGVRSDGNITLQDTPVPCHVTGGPITPGVGKSVSTVNNAGTCSNSTAPAAGPINLAAVATPTTTPDNSRICVTDKDVCTGGSDASWDSTNKRLVLSNSASVTLTGNLYVLCYLDPKTQSKITVSPTNGQPVIFYFPPPNSGSGTYGCPSGGANSDGSQIYFENQSSLVNNTGLGAKGIQFLVAGSASATTRVTIDNKNELNALFYAPNSQVYLINDASVKGGVAGAAVTMTASAKVTYDSSVATVGSSGGGGKTKYGQTQYAQCRTASGTDPNTNCP